MADDLVPGMAKAVEARRKAEGLSPTEFASRAGLTQQGLVDVRAGRRKAYAEKTRRGVARALRWPEDWYERMVAGEDPARFPDTQPTPTAADTTDLNSRVARLEPQDQAYIKDLIDRFERDLEEGR